MGLHQKLRHVSAFKWRSMNSEIIKVRYLFYFIYILSPLKNTLTLFNTFIIFTGKSEELDVSECTRITPFLTKLGSLKLSGCIALYKDQSCQDLVTINFLNGELETVGSQVQSLSPCTLLSSTVTISLSPNTNGTAHSTGNNITTNPPRRQPGFFTRLRDRTIEGLALVYGSLYFWSGGAFLYDWKNSGRNVTVKPGLRN